VFITHIGSFKPTVMFFRMINSLAMFQTIMNEILRDLINEGKVTVFVNNILVGTEMEKRHNEIVEETWGMEAHPQASLVTGPGLKVGIFAKHLEI